MKDRVDMEGAAFGIGDGVITVLGVLLGLSVTKEVFVLVLGILAAGLADSFANAMGMHIALETQKHYSKSDVRKSTIFCFLATFFTISILTIPFAFLSFNAAVAASWLMGMAILGGLGYFVSIINPKQTKWVIVEYIIMGIFVSVICYLLGKVVNYFHVAYR